MDDQSVARKLVNAVKADAIGYKCGTRPVHTNGVGVMGHFVASDVARTYCIAEHFQGQQVPVTVRFSNGSGTWTRHDDRSDIRGMATRFHLRGDAATDLLAMTLGEFFAPTVECFFKFSKTAQPAPVRRESPWQKILDMLQLKCPLPDPMPGQTQNVVAGALSFANQHRFAQLAIFEALGIGAPVSYARATYHAVHTFVVIAPDGIAPDGIRRYVRFAWQPVAGVSIRGATAPPDSNYLNKELDGRLRDWPAEFMLMMTIGETGDVLDDSTKRWPAKRIRIVMGTLTLTEVAKDQVASSEKISFNPCRLVPGIETSDDPILLARRDAYELSREDRHGTGCPFNRK